MNTLQRLERAIKQGRVKRISYYFGKKLKFTYFYTQTYTYMVGQAKFTKGTMATITRFKDHNELSNEHYLDKFTPVETWVREVKAQWDLEARHQKAERAWLDFMEAN